MATWKAALRRVGNYWCSSMHRFDTQFVRYLTWSIHGHYKTSKVSQNKVSLLCFRPQSFIPSVLSSSALYHQNSCRLNYSTFRKISCPKFHASHRTRDQLFFNWLNTRLCIVCEWDRIMTKCLRAEMRKQCMEWSVISFFVLLINVFLLMRLPCSANLYESIGHISLRLTHFWLSYHDS